MSGEEQGNQREGQVGRGGVMERTDFHWKPSTLFWFIFSQTECHSCWRRRSGAPLLHWTCHESCWAGPPAHTAWTLGKPMTPTTLGQSHQQCQAAGPPRPGPGSALQGLLCWQVRHPYFLVLPWVSVFATVHLSGQLWWVIYTWLTFVILLKNIFLVGLFLRLKKKYLRNLWFLSYI